MNVVESFGDRGNGNGHSNQKRNKGNQAFGNRPPALSNKNKYGSEKAFWVMSTMSCPTTLMVSFIAISAIVVAFAYFSNIYFSLVAPKTYSDKACQATEPNSRFWDIPDAVLLVISHLSKSDLISFGLCRRAFLELAEPLIWADVEDREYRQPLLSILPKRLENALLLASHFDPHVRILLALPFRKMNLYSCRT